MINLSLNELKLIAKNRHIQGYEKDFSELRHEFSKKEIDKFRKSFYNVKNHKNLYASEIKEAEKSLTKLEESLQFKKFYNDHYNDDKKLNIMKRLFDWLKPKKTDDSFGGRRNNYLEYISEGDDYENLSPRDYLDTIRPHLIDLINDHKTSGEWKMQLVMLNRCIFSINF